MVTSATLSVITRLKIVFILLVTLSWLGLFMNQRGRDS